MFNRVLIAEDLDDSRFYLKSVLEEKQFQVTDAENGKIAISRFRESAFDLVITDIRMPETDGLALLEAIKKESPQTPVIIISAYREPESIIEALRRGACDYITKPYEVEAVISSIKRVSRLVEDNAIDRAFTGCLLRESRQFVFGNDPEQINSTARFLCMGLDKTGLNMEKQLLQVSLIEALNNAIYHGNLGLSSKIKSSTDADSYDAYKEQARERQQLPPYKSRQLTVDYSLDEKKVCYVIRDEGDGFDVHKLPDPLDPESFQNPSGRGLLMIRTFCDEVTWNESGNEVTLIKYREDANRKS